MRVLNSYEDLHLSRYEKCNCYAPHGLHKNVEIAIVV